MVSQLNFNEGVFMTLKEYLKREKVKQLKLAKETGIGPTKLNLFINGWKDLEDFELNKLSLNLKLSTDQLRSNNIKGK